MPTPTGVSDAAYLCQQQERSVHDLGLDVPFGHHPDAEATFEALFTLIELGWTVGCDGELLPPRWLFRSFLES